MLVVDLHPFANYSYLSVRAGGYAAAGTDGRVANRAWFPFATSGFYPVDPSCGTYVLGVPQVRHVTIKICSEKTFAVVEKGR